MSDRIDWIPIAFGAWSTWAAFEAGAIIWDWMTKEEGEVGEVWTVQGLEEATTRLRLMQFESIRGFRMWFKCEYCPYAFGMGYYWRHFVVQRPLPKNGNWSEWAKEEPMSVLMAIECPIPNMPGRWVILRRYSLLDSSIYVDIIRVFKPRGFLSRCTRCDHLDDQTVVLVFINHQAKSVFLVVINLQQRSQYQINIVPSAPFHSVQQVFRREEKYGNRLRIVYYREGRLPLWPSCEFIIIDYELTRCNNEPSRVVAVEMSHQSIAFPHHALTSDHHIFCRLPGVRVLGALGFNEAPNLALCFDDRGDIHEWPLDEWKRDLEETDFGQRLLNARNDFWEILPHHTGEDYYLLHKYVLGTPTAQPRFDGMYMQRALYVPSERRLAAEAICQVNRSTDLSTFESEIGIDIFDGIIRDQAKPVWIVNIPRELMPTDEDD